MPLIEILRQGEEHGGGYFTANMMTGIDAKLQQKERMSLAATMQSPMIFVT